MKLYWCTKVYNYCTHSILRLVVDVSTEENNIIWVFTHHHHFWLVLELLMKMCYKGMHSKKLLHCN